MVSVQHMTYEEALQYAKSLKCDIDVLESPASWPHGYFHAIYPHATEHFVQNSGYKIRAKIRVQLNVTEYKGDGSQLKPKSEGLLDW